MVVASGVDVELCEEFSGGGAATFTLCRLELTASAKPAADA